MQPDYYLDCNLFPQAYNFMADLQEDKKLYLQEDIENFTFGGWECTLWTRVFLRVDSL